MTAHASHPSRRDPAYLSAQEASLAVQLDHETAILDGLLEQLPRDPREARRHPLARKVLEVAERGVRVGDELEAVREDLRRLSP